MNEILIGTGFYASATEHHDKVVFLRRWIANCHTHRYCIVDNSDIGLPPSPQTIRVRKNLGRNTDFAARHGKILGWSMSWIIPAMVAYSEHCDFVYKEQDCLAFGDWLSELRQGLMSFGLNSTMPCEQSLFWIQRDFIPNFVGAYLEHPSADNHMMTEEKMVEVSRRFGDACRFFQMPYGRERPLTFHEDKPWYAQRLTDDELATLDRHPRLV